MEPQNSPAVLTAIHFLRNSIAEKIWEAGERLPPLRKLAVQAHVSKNSMWKALTLAKKEQLITVTRGGYITVTGQSTTDREIKNAGPGHDRGRIWHQKRILLERDIFDGRFHERGILPPAKELQVTYGVCAVTLKKILKSLLDNGLIIPHKRSYRIPEMPKRKRYLQTIVWLSEKIDAGNVDINSQRLRKLVDMLEHLCAQSGIHIDFVDLNFLTSGMDLRIRTALKNKETTIGYIFDMPWTLGAENRKKTIDLAVSLAEFGKPIGIIDSTGSEISIPQVNSASNRIRIFKTAGRLAGQRVAQYLLGMGHRRIAYISQLQLHSNSNWSGQRLAGICDQYKSAGFEGNVIPFIGDYFHLSNLLNKPARKKLGKILALGEDAQDEAEFNRKDQISDEGMYLNDARIIPMQSTISLVGDLVDKAPDSDMVHAIRNAALLVASIKGNEVMMESLFEKMLADRTITAWVACNDGTAVTASKYLAKKNIRVPQDISVLGFDNTAESFEKKLTTFDFNMAGIIHHVLWFIRQPRLRAPGMFRDPEEIDGIIIERDSTGPVVRK